jgi:MoxR-like ATPase
MTWWRQASRQERAILVQLSRIERKLDALIKEETIEMAWIDDMRAEIANNTTVSQSAVAMVANLADQIQTLINNGASPAELQSFVDTLRANDVSVATAVAANTPAPPEPTPVPVPPEVLPTP